MPPRRVAAALVSVLTLPLESPATGGIAPAAPVREAVPPGEDPRVTWLRDNAVAVRSIAPDDDRFSDLEALRPMLEDARVVVLAESTHGDGNALLARTRLVRFLHQRLGYDVLAFESGFYDCWKAWQRVQAGEDAGTAFRDSVFPIWTLSRQVQPLIEHFAAAARSPRPLELAGIDPQFTGELSRRFFLEDLSRTAEAAGIPGERLAGRVSGPLANLLESRYERGERPDPAARAAFFAALAEIEVNLGRAGEAVPERTFWRRLLFGLRQMAVASWATDWKRPLLEDTVNFPVRDRVMGEHLVWLARERYPGRRIIVWTHAGHAARALAGVEAPSPGLARLYRSYQPAGAVAYAELGEELYTVAVLAYQGRFGTVFRQGPGEELLRPSAGSLEDLFHRTGLDHAFLDLRHAARSPRWLRARLVARPIGYTEMRARWHEVFDGILFLDAMSPSDRVSGAPR